MSKKSTSRSGDDGGADSGSATKCDSIQNLSEGEETAAGPSGDYSPATRKILAASSDASHGNHIKQTFTTGSTSSSRSSLNEELYGSSDTFMKNLEALRKKLRLLEMMDKSSSSMAGANKHNGTSPRSDTENCSRFSEDQHQAIKPRGYLSARGTLVDLNSPREVHENPEKYSAPLDRFSFNRSPITTIYEVSENTETEHTASSCELPEKRICLRRPSPKIESINLSKSTSSVPAKISYIPSQILFQQNDSHSICSKSPTTSVNNDINYTVPIKRRCLRSVSPKLSVKSKYLSTSAETTNVRFLKTHRSKNSNNNTNSQVDTNSPCKVKNCNDLSINFNHQHVASESDFLSSDRIVELGLNLPSSTEEDYTTPNSPIEPNIVVIDTNNKKVTKALRKNRVEPLDLSSISLVKQVSSTSSSNSTNRNKSNNTYLHSEINLLRKYYDETSEISSNLYSTPPGFISSCTSQSSSIISQSSDISTVTKHKKRFCTNKESAEVDMKPKVFNPLICSSLDIARIFRYTYVFPAFSKITLQPECFEYRGNKDYLDECGEQEEELLNDEIETCFKDKAEALLKSTIVSANNLSPNISKDKPSINSVLKQNKCFRKKQSTEMSFYSVSPNATVADDLQVARENHRKRSSSIKEADTGCFCFSILFPRRKNNFFS